MFNVHRFSHFHLDHCGALPYMSEMVGFDGPIYMTHPTKAICPILLVRDSSEKATCHIRLIRIIKRFSQIFIAVEVFLVD